MKKINVIEECKKLISLDSTNPNKYEYEIINYIKSYLNGQNIDYKTIKKNKSLRENLIVSIKGLKEEIIVLNGHVDTKPIGDKDKWKTNPLEGIVIGDFLYGLGASDMKGGIASLISLMKTIIDNKLIPLYTLEFHFVVDEENNSRFGMAYLSEENLINFKDYSLVVVCEPTNNFFVERSLGNKWIEMKIKGKRAHAGKHFEGESAPNELSKILGNILSYIEKLKGSDSDFLEFPNINVGILEGGDHPGTVQENAKAVFDIRVYNEKHKSTILRKLEKLIEKSSLEISVCDFAPEMYSWNMEEFEKNSNVYSEIKNKIIKNNNQKKKGLFFGGSDAGYYQTKGSPVCIFGPGSLEFAHQPNERIKIYELIEHYEILLKVFIGEEYE